MTRRIIENLRTRVDALERYVVDIVYDRRHDRAARILAFFLKGLAWVFEGLVRLRYFLYRHRIFRNQPLGCLVVVVGNLTVGGTGKTPVVERFARELHERGRKVAILSRGYKSKKEPLYKKGWRALTHSAAPPPKVVSDGERVLLGPHDAGDEPYMLARNLPGVVVVVDKNRVKAGAYAIRKFQVDTLILDDGLQYMALKGRLNLVLVDKTNPFGNGNTLPRGILREPIKHLKRADYVFLTKSDGRRSLDLESVIHRRNPGVEIIECTHRPVSLRSLDQKRVEPLSVLEGRRIAAFSGIAAPESFERFLREQGAEIRYNRRFMDHHWFSDYELKKLFSRATEAGLDMIVTTEKDAVRIDASQFPSVPLYYLRLEIGIIRGAADFEEAVSRICFPGTAGQVSGQPAAWPEARPGTAEGKSGVS